jgi:8-oxo-dGTP pyrophosphatase MutT (NUDIX family)
MNKPKEDSFHLGIKAIIRDNKGQILLLQTNPKQLKGYTGKPYWDIPGGRIHIGSSVEETLKREVEEETGRTTIKNFTPFSMVLSSMRIPINSEETVGLILSSYICEVGNASDIKLSDEHISYEWFSPKKASEALAFKYPQEFVSKIAEIKT